MYFDFCPFSSQSSVSLLFLQLIWSWFWCISFLHITSKPKKFISRHISLNLPPALSWPLGGHSSDHIGILPPTCNWLVLYSVAEVRWLPQGHCCTRVNSSSPRWSVWECANAPPLECSEARSGCPLLLGSTSGTTGTTSEGKSFKVQCFLLMN